MLRLADPLGILGKEGAPRSSANLNESESSSKSSSGSHLPTIAAPAAGVSAKPMPALPSAAPRRRATRGLTASASDLSKWTRSRSMALPHTESTGTASTLHPTSPPSAFRSTVRTLREAPRRAEESILPHDRVSVLGQWVRAASGCDLAPCGMWRLKVSMKRSLAATSGYPWPHATSAWATLLSSSAAALRDTASEGHMTSWQLPLLLSTAAVSTVFVAALDAVTTHSTSSPLAVYTVRTKRDFLPSLAASKATLSTD
mmetsp:Transcript_40414/g.101108  ORF Transcript_40414/g.101108 Transcript_40414/m.101108 type:complete len:258 (+) Transcript_40414:182-955(+)